MDPYKGFFANQRTRLSLVSLAIVAEKETPICINMITYTFNWWTKIYLSITRWRSIFKRNLVLQPINPHLTAQLWLLVFYFVIYSFENVNKSYLNKQAKHTLFNSAKFGIKSWWRSENVLWDSLSILVYARESIGSWYFIIYPTGILN